jgi:magnesium-protoporphyrin O-methyltransferase
MDCCTQKALNQTFTPETARAEIRDFRKHGLKGTDKLLAETLVRRGIQGASVLEVGGGIGGVQIELLRAGASRAVDVDIAEAYVAGARELAQSLGFAGVTEQRVLDFAQGADAVEAADVVIMNRVICCYPLMPALVRPAAQHARRLLALVFPREGWYMHVGERVANFFMWLFRNDFRIFVHSNRAILAEVSTGGLRPVFDQTRGLWRVLVFERVDSQLS